jgi:small-conductance mechanosensitive channel
MYLSDLLNYSFHFGKYSVSVSELLAAALILLGAKMTAWLVRHVLFERFFKRKKIDQGRQLALKQFSTYIVYVIAVFLILELMGLSSAIWAGSAGLLVGIGLGLQETFKDLVSGIVILTEGTVEVGDVIEIDGMVAIVRRIGLRTSVVETRDNVSILIPNSKLVVDKVVNMSHNESATRFQIKVGVAYGSDVRKVEKILLEAASGHSKVLQKPAPSVQFVNFGESSLDFTLYFYSNEFFRIDPVKSDIRFTIDGLFRENKIQIPFPQTEMWIRRAEDLGIS